MYCSTSPALVLLAALAAWHFAIALATSAGEQEQANRYLDYDVAKRVVKIEGSLPSYKFTVGLAERLSGLTHVGHAARLRLVLERARRGEALRVGALGGSITAGQGTGGVYHTYPAAFAAWLNAAFPPSKDAKPLPPFIASAWSGAAAGEAPGKDGSGVGTDPTFAAAETGTEGWEGWGQEGEEHQEGRSEGGDGGSGGGFLGALSRLFGWGRRRRRAQEAVEPGEGARRRSLGGPPKHLIVNGGVPGTTSAYMSACFHHHLPPGVDLVFVEYSVNDPPDPSPDMGSSDRRALERLLRKVLALPSRPAVVLVHMYAHEAAEGRFYHTAQRDIGELGMLYGLPAVSLRDAVLPAAVCSSAPSTPSTATSSSSAAPAPKTKSGRGLLARKTSKPTPASSSSSPSPSPSSSSSPSPSSKSSSPFSSASAPAFACAAATSPAAVALGAIFNGGRHHPGRGGHVVVTELLITLALDLLDSNQRLQREADVLRLLHSAQEGAVGGDGTATVDMDGKGAEAEGGPGGVTDAAGAALAWLRALAVRPLPAPMARGNYEAGRSTCYLEHELKDLVGPGAEGWAWTDEGRAKWGWVAAEPGKQLRLKLNTQVSSGSEEPLAYPQPIIVQLAYLKSYELMGTARVECESGCACEAATVDALDPRPVSVTAMHDVKVSQHPECVLLITTAGPGKARQEGKGGDHDRSTGKDAEGSRDKGKGKGKDGKGKGKGGDREGEEGEKEEEEVEEEDEEGGKADGEQEAGGPAKRGPQTVPGSKFKILGVVVGEEPGATAGGVSWVRPETSDLAKYVKILSKKHKGA
ncbi:hypothetical protein HYH03_001911 [Edaphochlamys debaryana]|uniref:SGNH hydrolase-type esterase domain-containing protein n=1 Tax=Edaphochlamys debaryana TaxID=47281 RepID=A0A836C4Y6_9CHLO|nr:hypothetical protein HYH03_001911 [Edaphochlamys debaryana]|eukprot:KAG2500335.1 hypothetical protein HYH03_001911 [Edaphochlamys debaryana]